MTDQNLPQPSAQGTLGKTPFPHLLIYVLERQLSGTMEFTAPDGERATILVINGAPSKMRLGESLAYLGHVLLEEGMVDEDALQRSTQAWAEKKAHAPILHGRVMRELGILDENSLREGLRRQLVRKCEHLLNWPAETRFEYYDQLDALTTFGAPAEVTIDPLPLVWSAIRQFPSWDHANAALTKLGNSAIKLSAGAVIDRLDLGPSELAIASELRARPLRLIDLTALKHASPSITQLFVYCLLIAKQLDVLHDEGAIAAAQAMAGTAQRPMSAPPSSSAALDPSVPPSPSSSSPLSVSSSGVSSQGAQVARVQLSKSRVQALPSATVEERAPIVRIDGRIATPMPGAVTAHPGDLSAAAPVAVAASTKAVPPPPLGPSPDSLASGSLSGSVPETPGPASTHGSASTPVSLRGAMLSAAFKPAEGAGGPASGKATELAPEHKALRQKILERAGKIQKENYFEMLGIAKDATDTEVKMAFIQLAKEWHPDRLPAALAEVKPEISKIFSHFGEAHATLSDPHRRGKYMGLLREGGATPEDQETIARVVEATMDFQKAEHFLKRNELVQSEDFARKALLADPEQNDYAVLVAWLESHKVANQHEDKTLEHIAVMSEALRKSPRNERAVFYRAQLYKRLGKNREALADFRYAVELNPRNIDAARELRLYNMRRDSKAPPGSSGFSSAPPPPPTNKAVDIFGKLFKK